MPSSRGKPVGLLSGPQPTYPGVRFFIVGGIATVAAVLGYRFYSERATTAKRDALLADEKRAEDALAGDWNVFRDTAERMIRETAERSLGDDKAFDPVWDFRSRDGLYVRMPTKDALKPVSLRHGIEVSKRDGFISCLLRPDPTKDAGAGFTEQPWNLEDAYRSTRLFADAWKTDLRETTDELRVRAFREQFERAEKDELPKARDILRRAEFLLVVLDDEAEGVRKLADGGGVSSELLSSVTHPARVAIYSLKEKRLAAFSSFTVSAGFTMAQAQGITAKEADAPSQPTLQSAMQRQANNCALAQETKHFFKLPN